MNYRIGDIVTGKVTGIQAYGVFVMLDEKTQGLIHISECQHGFVKDLSDLFQIDQVLEVIILDIDEYTQNSLFVACVADGYRAVRTTTTQTLLDQS